MRKLQLDIEDLAVETFSANEDEAPGRGTVRAHQKYTYFCQTGVEECHTYTCGDSDVYHCPKTHDWDFGSCVAGGCIDSNDTFCAWTTPCNC